MTSKQEKAWKPCGYIGKSRSGATAVIMIGGEDGAKTYYVADIQDTLQALTGNLAYAKVYRKK